MPHHTQLWRRWGKTGGVRLALTSQGVEILTSFDLLRLCIVLFAYVRARIRASCCYQFHEYGWLFDHGACLVRAAHLPSVICPRYNPRGDPESNANSQTTAKELPDPANTRQWMGGGGVYVCGLDFPGNTGQKCCKGAGGWFQQAIFY